MRRASTFENQATGGLWDQLDEGRTQEGSLLTVYEVKKKGPALHRSLV